MEVLNTTTTPQNQNQDLSYLMENWQQIVKRYQMPSMKKAIPQMITSFVPFIALWGLMYWSLSVSLLAHARFGLF